MIGSTLTLDCGDLSQVTANERPLDDAEGRWSLVSCELDLSGLPFEASPVVDAEELKNRIFIWLCRNPGKYPRDVADHFGISGLQASETVGELLREGLLDFAE